MLPTTEERIRYPKSVDPVSTDGRDVDTGIATLEGEGAAQESPAGDPHLRELAPQPWTGVPEVTPADTTYYDRPLLKPSVWGLDIPAYYYLGGAAGAALTLGAAIQLVSSRGQRELRRVSAICHWTGIVGSTAGAALLIHDLGRPSRFLHMMRVFRPASPMNVGVWILGGAAPAAITTGLLVRRTGMLGRIGDFAGYLSGIFGAALAGYTGVLVANTAIPIWQESGQWLPVLFVASSAATAGSVIDILTTDRHAHRVTRVFGTAGRIGEIAAAKKLEHAASTVPRVGQPFRSGTAGFLWNTAAVLTVASLAVSALPVTSPGKRKAAAWLAAAGSLCLRFAVHSLGNASARDPRAAFQQQRQGGKA